MSLTDIKNYFFNTYNIKVGKSTIWKILQNKDIINEIENENYKKNKKQKIVELERKLYECILCAENHNVPINAKILINNAKMFSDKETLNIFKFSNGWLENFKRNYKIKSRKIFGDTKLKNKDKFEIRINEIKNLLINVNINDIYNFDECGLFYKLLQNRSLGTNDF